MITPLAMVAVAGAWLMLVYAWLVWWMLLMIALPVALLA